MFPPPFLPFLLFPPLAVHSAVVVVVVRLAVVEVVVVVVDGVVVGGFTSASRWGRKGLFSLVNSFLLLLLLLLSFAILFTSRRILPFFYPLFPASLSISSSKKTK